jgi:hypothetical protein
MTNSEIFHNETISFGGRFQRERAPENVKSVYGVVEDRAQDLISAARRGLPNLPQIHFDFILNGGINAVAFRSKQGYFIGCYTGTLFMLRSVIGRMLSDSRLFQHVGDAKAERGDLRPLADYVPNAEVMYKREAILTPNDAIRRAYVEFLQDQAIMFLVGHELTHITHGHVDYLRAKRGHRVTTELGWFEQRDQEERFERQCLEQDADRRSIMSRIDSLRLTFDNPNRPPIPWRPTAEHPTEMILDWAISVNILFRLFGDVRFSRTELADYTYPPLPLRRGMCEVAALWSVERIWGPEWKTFAGQALKMARNETESAFSIMLGEEVKVGGLQEAFSKEGAEHATRLQNYWNSTLVELLRPYSYEF